MAMDPNNYVAPVAGGGYAVVVNGQQQGSTIPDLNTAQQTFNTLTGQSNGAAAGATDQYNSAAAAQADTVAAQLAANQIAQGQLDLDKIKQAWLQTYQTAQLTGTYNGQPTLQAGEDTGSINGTSTLASQIASGVMANGQPTFQSADALGYINGKPTLATGEALGNINGAPTLAAQQDNQQNAISYLDILKGLTGPANAFDYAKALTGTPGGLADIVRAAGGQYTLPSFGGGNNQPITPLSIQSMINDVNQYTPTNLTPGASTLAPTTQSGAPSSGASPPPATLATSDAKAVAQGQGSGSAAASPLPAPPSGSAKGALTSAAAAGAPTNTAAPSASVAQEPAQAATGSLAPNYVSSNGGLTQSAPSYVPSYGPLVAPNQLSPQAYNNMTPSQMTLLMGAYGQQGYLPGDVTAMYQKSLSAYAPKPSTGGVGF